MAEKVDEKSLLLVDHYVGKQMYIQISKLRNSLTLGNVNPNMKAFFSSSCIRKVQFVWKETQELNEQDDILHAQPDTPTRGDTDTKKNPADLSKSRCSYFAPNGIIRDLAQNHIM